VCYTDLEKTTLAFDEKRHEIRLETCITTLKITNVHNVRSRWWIQVVARYATLRAMQQEGQSTFGNVDR